MSSDLDRRWLGTKSTSVRSWDTHSCLSKASCSLTISFRISATAATAVERRQLAVCDGRWPSCDGSWPSPDGRWKVRRKRRRLATAVAISTAAHDDRWQFGHPRRQSRRSSPTANGRRELPSFLTAVDFDVNSVRFKAWTSSKTAHVLAVHPQASVGLKTGVQRGR